ncbi:hypothetical protein IEQ34_003009 [Dendrobium chrysotoxum]|uniref:Uncharacterized protein n=1 Tax=Dendrobium chrysotoxum TaxID=161865 RepID=A0AAV7HHG4_DENCH|nr:hypothetical protein IEQ34_003009 [Dendrobium chrysotoxum]
MMYASPLSIMKRVIRTKSAEYIPLYLSIAYFFNGLCWTTYSLIHLDVNLTIPNAIGLLFAIAQLLLHVIYNKSTKRQSIEGKIEVVLVEVYLLLEELINKKYCTRMFIVVIISILVASSVH